jgi:hypothetical protein
MKAPATRAQAEATQFLIKFIRDHNGTVDGNLTACLIALEEGDVETAVRHAKLVKPHGMGDITDWVPKPASASETPSYNAHTIRALTNEWCRLIALLFADRDRVSRDAQKGALNASVRADGWVVCPFCGKTFSSKSDSWDGERHTSCGVRLQLVPENPGAT